MSAIQCLMGWVVIGFAAAIVGCIMPFRRGTIGLAVNAVVGVGGALAGPFLAIALGISHSARDPRSFGFATLGAVVALALLHVIWELRTRGARQANQQP